ncbi:glycosyltransferase, partial [bacterium]|nr:glycosyltransferase [bacterium]
TYRMKNAIKYCDYIITANDVVRARSLIYNRFKLVDIISNVPNLTIFNEEGVKETNSSIILCHEGSLSFNRGLKEMISLIEEQKYNLKLKIIGDIRGDEKKWLDEKIHNNPSLIKSIYITEWLPYEKVGAAIEECDIGLILFYPTINNMLAGPPNKLFNYMRYGLPIVTVDLPETRMVIRKYGCGLIVKNWDINTFIQSVKYLIDNPSEAKAMGQRGKEAIINELSWQKQGEKLLKIYDELLNPQPFIIA